MTTNCTRVRFTSRKEPVGVALDLLTSTVNHSCSPNAFAFWEEGQLRVRSLKSLKANDEMTVCYLDPTSVLLKRRTLLERDHFFYCRCDRCETEYREYRTICCDNSNIKAALHKAQDNILALIASVAKADKEPGPYPAFEDLKKVETQLQTIIEAPFCGRTGGTWPKNLEPLPSARMSLATFYFKNLGLESALRLAILGLQSSAVRDPALRANDTCDMLRILIQGAFAVSCIGKDESLVTAARLLVYGYMSELCDLAARAYGHDCKYPSDVCKMYTSAIRGVDLKPGEAGFSARFQNAQARLMEWAGKTNRDTERV